MNRFSVSNETCNLHTQPSNVPGSIASVRIAQPHVNPSFNVFIALSALLLGCLLSGCEQQAPEASATEAFVDSLLQTMSLESKVGEMTQLTLGAIEEGGWKRPVEPQRLDSAKARRALVAYQVGSILNCGNHAHSPAEWHEFIAGIQGFAAEKETKIPVLYGVDAIHGPTYTSDAVLGPQQIGLAATWNEALVRKNARATALQVAACGIPWNFSPVLDMGRDPRWPRFWETFGEDPLLTSRLGVAMVEGYQNQDVPFAATLKHFFGYGFTLSGKDRTPGWIPERELREYFLPPFEAAINAGAMSIMVNSGELNGIPVHANRHLLTDVLRDELGFEGVLVTDWADIKYLYERHMVAADYKDATRLAIEAGIDMSMVPLDFGFTEALLELVREGTVSEDRIDESVRRILLMKAKLGLFETGGLPPALDAYPEKARFEGTAARAALESITLLKNDGNHAVYADQPILPIGGTGKVFVTGPTAHSLNALNGGWTGTWQGTDPAFNTPGRPHLAEAMKEQFGEGRVVDAALDMNFSEVDIANVVAKVKRTQPQCIVVALGEMPYTEFVGNIEDLSLYPNQKSLVRALYNTGVPVIGVFIEGRPRTFDDIEPLMDGIVMAYLPGDYGAQAIAQVLDGSYNPSGHLPFTWPRNPSAHLTYDHKHTERVHADSTINAFNPQYEFGHGLSYGAVQTSGLSVDKKVYALSDTISVELDLSNTGPHSTNALVLLFSQDQVASITPSVDRLEDFQRHVVGSGETVHVEFELPVSNLTFVNSDLERVVEPGTFGLRVNHETIEIQINS